MNIIVLVYFFVNFIQTHLQHERTSIGNVFIRLAYRHISGGTFPVDYLCGRAQSIVGGAIPGQVAVGGAGKVAEYESRSSIPSCSWLQFWPLASFLSPWADNS